MADNSTSTLPVNVGVVLFPGFQALDVFGPLDALNILSRSYPLNLSLISSLPTLDPVSTQPPASVNAIVGPPAAVSNFSQSLVPTHTIDAPPASLDVLLVPGGLGTRAPGLEPLIDYIGRTAKETKYVLTVCTGSWLAARAGALDGKNATSNKRAWAGREGLGNNVNWIKHARWVQDGDTWTSSGVSAGIDMVLAWMESVFGKGVTEDIANGMEYERHTDPNWDPFAELYGP
uniref:DJ-1/PfpI domain-containing protein n=2 Tax=Schizophyllum commune (strain H4-8 / FGSC 9210) TaxID=578458 RepID=D8Q030_SCHCM